MLVCLLRAQGGWYCMGVVVRCMYRVDQLANCWSKVGQHSGSKRFCRTGILVALELGLQRVA